MDRREPTLDELLNEPIIRKVMAADGYSAEDIRLLLRQASARAYAGSYRQKWRAGGACELRRSDTRQFPN